MGADRPKQYLEIKGYPLLVYTIAKFLEIEWNDFVISAPEDWQDETKKLVKGYFPNAGIKVIKGGATRTDSVRNCLDELKRSGKNGVVAIHDGVRPLLSQELISNCLKEAQRCGSALPVVNPVETVRMGPISETSIVPRDRIHLVQTPQCFDLGMIIEAHENKKEGSYTDDAGIFEERFGQVSLIQGEEKNIKVTNRSDLDMVASLLPDDPFLQTGSDRAQ